MADEEDFKFPARLFVAKHNAAVERDLKIAKKTRQRPDFPGVE